MNYLIVVAHPDDEVLGAGATIYKIAHSGNKVDLCVMSAAADARAFRPEEQELTTDMESCSQLLGITKRFEENFPNIQFNTVPHLQLVQAIERAIVESEPDVIITHHPADTNNDHLHT
ncbi:MAG: PIG-L family deacetylase, partial [Oscillospiraceae bacterium]